MKYSCNEYNLAF